MTLTKTQLTKLSKSDLIEIILSTQNGLTPLPKTGTEIIQGFVYENGNSPATMILKINCKKFKIRYENTNGVPMGFNYKFSASVMDESGKWNYVAEKKDISFNPISYVFDFDNKFIDAKKFMNAMQKYLEKVYS